MSSGARLPFTPQHISAWHPERCPLSERRCECLRMALVQKIRKINVLQKTDGYTCFRIFGASPKTCLTAEEQQSRGMIIRAEEQ